jgi:hypothetical protein
VKPLVPFPGDWKMEGMVFITNRDWQIAEGTNSLGSVRHDRGKSDAFPQGTQRGCGMVCRAGPRPGPDHSGRGLQFDREAIELVLLVKAFLRRLVVIGRDHKHGVSPGGCK